MYKFLEHPSETLIEVDGKTPEDVFRDAAIALSEIMTDTTCLKVTRDFGILLSAPGLDFLLIDWLNRLIYLHETENVFLCQFDVQLLRSHGEWTLTGVAGGEEISKEHERRSHAKSATYGQLEWVRTPNGYRAHFVIDI